MRHGDRKLMVYGLRFMVYCLPFTVYCLLFTVERLGKATANMMIGRIYFEKMRLKLTALIFVTTRPHKQA